MAKGDSAEKAYRRSLRQRVRNRQSVRTLRTLVRGARESIAAGEAEGAEAARQATIALDRAATRGTIHPNNAARKKSRLMRLLHKAEAT